MGKQKKTRKFAEVKRMISANDLKQAAKNTKPSGQQNTQKKDKGGKAGEGDDEVRHVEKYNSSLFFKYNTALGPPYQASLQNELESDEGEACPCAEIFSKKKCTRSSLLFSFSSAQVLIDTNFINFSIRNKIDLVTVRSSSRRR